MALPVWFDASSGADDAARDVTRSSRETEADLSRPRLVSDRGPSPDDQALVARVRAGDRAAFAELYTKHLPLLMAFAYGYVQSEALAQDIVADLFTHLWEIRNSWEPRHSIRGYLLTAVRHRALNVRRDTARTDTLLAHGVATGTPTGIGEAPMAPDEHLETEERRALVRRAIDRLSPDRRRAMMLRWRFELTPVEIAQAMGIPRAAVDQLISRGLKALRQLIRE